MKWKNLMVSQRVARLQWLLPLVIGVVVVLYQSFFVDLVEQLEGHLWHYIVEIIFYGMVGPIVTFFVLMWIRRWLVEKEKAEQKIKEQEQRLALIKLEEGRRVAQHLHREVLPNMAYVANKIAHIRNKLPPAAANQQLDDEMLTASNTLRDTIGDLRQKINQLRRGVTLHSLKEGSDFLAEVQRRTKEFEKMFQLKFDISIKGDTGNMPFAVESSLWRIIGEALNNIALHADATEVKLTLDFRDPQQVVLVIIDDGEGFNSEATLANGTGLGLLHMQEETGLQSGTLAVQSKPGQGTRITAAFPLLAKGVAG